MLSPHLQPSFIPTGMLSVKLPPMQGYSRSSISRRTVRLTSRHTSSFGPSYTIESCPCSTMRVANCMRLISDQPGTQPCWFISTPTSLCGPNA